MPRRLALAASIAILAPASSLAQGLEDRIAGLFLAYEREDIGGFLRQVDPTFAGSDRSGNAHRAADLPRALADDFAILDRVRFEATVGRLRIEEDGRTAWAPVRWSRRALVEIGGAEWIVRAHRSVLVLVRGPSGDWRLAGLHGDPLFALAGFSGRILATEGDLDGEPIRKPVELDRFGR